MKLAGSLASFAYQGMRHSPWLTAPERWGMSRYPSSLSCYLWGMTLAKEGKRPEILSAPCPRLSGSQPGEA